MQLHLDGRSMVRIEQHLLEHRDPNAQRLLHAERRYDGGELTVLGRRRAARGDADGC